MPIKYQKKELPYYRYHNNKLTQNPHIHKEVELIYLTSGSCVATADNRRLSMQPGDLFVCFPHQIHYYLSVEQPLEVYVILFSTEMIYGLEKEFQSMSPMQHIIHIEPDSFLDRLLRDFPPTVSDISLTKTAGNLNLLMSKIMPQLQLTEHMRSNYSSLQRILNCCEMHYREQLTLDRVADELHISKYYISRLLNERMQLGFSDYINMLRINDACIILEMEPERKLSDISEEVGFGSIRSFNRAFQKINRITPASYRKLLVEAPAQIRST